MGKIEESCLNRVKKYCLLNETYYSGITEEEKKSLIALIKTAKDTDSKTTTFPDFIDDIFLPYIKFNDMRNGIIEDDNLPFEIVHDKEIMDFIQQYQADIQYVIFVSKRIVKILKTSSIHDILTEKIIKILPHFQLLD